MFSIEDVTLLLTALKFSAEKHRHQRRKDPETSPYINHPIQVAELLWQQGGVRDIVTIVGALLHDTLEDTNTTPEEIEALLGGKKPSVTPTRCSIRLTPVLSVPPG